MEGLEGGGKQYDEEVGEDRVRRINMEEDV